MPGQPIPLLVAVMGPTASGKTALAERLADSLDAQLINSDIFQAYRGMSIGTAQPEDPDRYLFVGIQQPDEEFSLGTWITRCSQALQDLWRNRRSAILVGGGGLNIRALLEEFDSLHAAPDPSLRASLNQQIETVGLEQVVETLRALSPETADRTDLLNPARVVRAIERLSTGDPIKLPPVPPFKQLKIGLEVDTNLLNQRIVERFDVMMARGWLEEVVALRKKGYGPTNPSFKAHGYRHLYAHLDGEMELPEARERTINEIIRYAKRQRTWLRREPRIESVRAENPSTAFETVANKICYLRENQDG